METNNSIPKSPALPPPPFEAPIEEEPEDILVGGYVDADIDDEASLKAKNLMIDAIYKKYPTRALVDKVDMEIQVVAGLNYRFRVEMTGAQSTRDIFTGTVYRDIRDNYELTSLNKLKR